jgi:hypothetical protein
MIGREPVEVRAATDLVIVAAHAVWRAIQQRCQPGPALYQWQSSQVLAVQKQQVEEEENQRSLRGTRSVAKATEALRFTTGNRC